MAEKLCEMLREKYHSTPRSFAIYPKEGEMIERIFINITNKDAFDAIDLYIELITPKDIENIAREIFNDRTYEFSPDGYYGAEISFLFDTRNEYLKSYNKHTISVASMARPKFLICVGDGTTVLNDRQRAKYFEFVNKMYELFVESAKKS